MLSGVAMTLCLPEYLKGAPERAREAAAGGEVRQQERKGLITARLLGASVA